jgi:type II secretory pathway pseudopilin PulG
MRKTGTTVARGRLQRRPLEAGYSMVMLVASMTVMFILMGAAVPTWKYIMKNDREEELLYRGGEIADAIGRFQKKNANAYPTSLDQLVKGKFLRKAYKDPMSKDGKWKLVHQGQAGAQGGPAGIPGMGGAGTGLGTGSTPTTTTTSTTLAAGPGGSGGLGGTTVGPILGVVSTSTEKSLRIFNGRTQYNEWIFAAGQPRVIGQPPTIGAGGLPGGTKSSKPTPLPKKP